MQRSHAPARKTRIRPSPLVWLAVCCMFAVVVSSTAHVAHPAKSPSPSALRAGPLFSFHSNFWVNLHQTLVREALLREKGPGWRLANRVPLSTQGVPRQAVAKWNRAVGFYAARFNARDELFDARLIRINDELATQPDDGLRLDAGALPTELVSVLRLCAPIYRKYWWPAQNRSNERWIASQRTGVDELGRELASALTRDLRQPWPVAPIRVDVSFYVPEIGHAYTTTHPAHTTIASGAAHLRGMGGFEILFHEASHTFAETEQNAISMRCRAEHKNCGDLWHALLFYTSGVELRRVLPADERASFTPYAYRYGLYAGAWAPYLQVLQADWQPYLDGKTTFSEAMDRMVSALQQ